MNVKLVDNRTLVATGDLPESIIESKVMLKWRNKTYRYSRQTFDGVVWYEAVSRALEVDDIFREMC